MAVTMSRTDPRLFPRSRTSSVQVLHASASESTDLPPDALTEDEEQASNRICSIALGTATQLSQLDFFHRAFRLVLDYLLEQEEGADHLAL